MYKHFNTRTGTITLTDSKGQPHVIFPGGTVFMDRIREGKGVICVNKDSEYDTATVTIKQNEKKPKQNRKHNKLVKQDKEED